jgi:cysteinyl-tRNA synthetase
MSKSLGNFYTLEDLIAQGWKPREIRYTLLSAHYRQQLNFTVAGLEAARGSLERLDACVRNLRFSEGGGAEHLTGLLNKHETDFQDAMDDDLNYPNGLAALFNLIRDVNTHCIERKIGPDEAEEVRQTLQRLDSVFGFIDVDKSGDGESDEAIELLIQARNDARKARDWAEADRIRQKLADQNVIIEDRAGGTVWRRK